MGSDKSHCRRYTVVVNLFGGPGCGKTTLAHELTAALSRRGLICEYAPEYAKDLTWDAASDDEETASAARSALGPSIEQQRAVHDEQMRRINRPYGSVDAVVTDSPAIISWAYTDGNEDGIEEFREYMLREFMSHRNLNLLVSREVPYEQIGRNEDEETARRKDGIMLDILRRTCEPFAEVGKEDLGAIVSAVESMAREGLTAYEAIEREGLREGMREGMEPVPAIE